MNNRFIDGVVEYLIEISEDSYTISPGMLKVDAGIAAPRHNQGQAFVKPAKEKKSKNDKDQLHLYILPSKRRNSIMHTVMYNYQQYMYQWYFFLKT